MVRHLCPLLGLFQGNPHHGVLVHLRPLLGRLHHYPGNRITGAPNEDSGKPNPLVLSLALHVGELDVDGLGPLAPPGDLNSGLRHPVDIADIVLPSGPKSTPDAGAVEEITKKGLDFSLTLVPLILR
jgi:hypothetical protein